MPSLGADVLSSLNIASRCSNALNASLEKLRAAVAARRWDDVEDVRAEMLAAVDGYVDNYVAAGRRVELERG